MVNLARESPSAAHTWFMNKLIPLLEKLVPVKLPRKKGRNKAQKKRNLLWRRLSKISKKIETASSLPKISKLLQDKWDLEMEIFLYFF